MILFLFTFLKDLQPNQTHKCFRLYTVIITSFNDNKVQNVSHLRNMSYLQCSFNKKKIFVVIFGYCETLCKVFGFKYLEEFLVKAAGSINSKNAWKLKKSNLYIYERTN